MSYSFAYEERVSSVKMISIRPHIRLVKGRSDARPCAVSSTTKPSITGDVDQAESPPRIIKVKLTST